MSMIWELKGMLKVLDEYIEILKQNLLFLMAERQADSQITEKIIMIKRELDNAVQKRMKLSRILLSS
jgi:hypothetical protein